MNTTKHNLQLAALSGAVFVDAGNCPLDLCNGNCAGHNCEICCGRGCSGEDGQT